MKKQPASALAWIVGLAMVGLVFDGYDLVVYGTVVSTFLRDPSQLGPVSPAVAGALGSYALFGVLVGALAAGAVGDLVGRRKLMLGAYAWFAVGMGATAMTHDATAFGLLRFVTGLGIGTLLGTTAALVSEYAPPGKKNLYNALTYSGIPLGSVLAAALAIALLDRIGWRGMFWIGALPLVTLLPLAWFKMPESVRWLQSRGRHDDAARVAARFGLPLAAAAASDDEVPAPAGARAGFAGLFDRDNRAAALLLGGMSATGLLLVYSLNTWLPELMLRAGFDAKGSLAFLLVLNGGSLFGGLAASRLADRFGARPVVAASFALGALSIAMLTLHLPLGVLLATVSLVGLGTSGTQTLIYGFAANRFRTNVRGAGVAWCAGFGRLGGVGGPVLGGLLVGGGFALESILVLLAGLALLGVALTLLVPLQRRAAAAERAGTPMAASAPGAAR